MGTAFKRARNQLSMTNPKIKIRFLYRFNAL